jgi:hypothetical protein
MDPDPFGGEPEPGLTSLDALIDELERQAALLTAVATGGSRIDDVQREYQDRRRRLAAALERRGSSTSSRGSGTGTGPPTRRGTCGGRRSVSSPLPSSRLLRQRSGLSVSDPGSGPLTWADLDARRYPRSRSVTSGIFGQVVQRDALSASNYVEPRYIKPALGAARRPGTCDRRRPRSGGDTGVVAGRDWHRITAGSRPQFSRPYMAGCTAGAGVGPVRNPAAISSDGTMGNLPPGARLGRVPIISWHDL